MKCEKVRLGDIIEIKKGSYITKKDSKEGPYPVILGGQEPAYYIDRFNHTGKAIVISRSGASAGYVSFWNEPIFVTDGFLIEPKDLVGIDFLYYLLKSNQSELQGKQAGAAIPHVNPRIINAIEVLLPQFSIQDKIVSILSAYDDLIENNQKQIKLLEEAAQRLYKEWFVDLRFPNYENTPVVDGVPEGWRKDLLGNCMIIKRGGSPRPIQSYLVDNGLNWLKISDVTSAIGYYITDIKEHIKIEGLRKTVLLKKGSLVLSNSATPGIPRILDVDSCIHDGWLYFEESIFTNEYLLLMFNEERKKIISLGTGAIFTNLKTDIIKNYPHIIPPKDVLEQFQSIINPLFSKIKTIQRSIKSLTEARDRLLPKLMSGELEV